MITKKRKVANSKVDINKAYSLKEASTLVKEVNITKFDSSVDLHIRLGVDPKKADQAIRGNIRQMSPQAADIYDQMTDVHAALSAVKNFKPGLIKSAGITAATHPMTTAALSPLAVPAAVAASEVVKPAAQKIKGMIPF